MHRPRPIRAVRPKAQTPTASLHALLGRHPPPAAVAEQLLRRHGFREPSRARAAIARLHTDALQRRNLARIFPGLIHACEKSADPDRALLHFERLVAALPNPNIFYHYLEAAPGRIELLARVFAHSQALAETVARNAENLHFLIAPGRLERPREKASLTAELARLLMPCRLAAQKYDIIRAFRRREMLRIGSRDLLGLAGVEETTWELSNLADTCLGAVLEIARESLCQKWKLPADAGKETTRFAVIGMGKLGGQELNYSSDVDVMFVYAEEGNLTERLTRHEFFTKLAGEFIEAVGAASSEGTIFRIDLRLRPEGAPGPLVRSLDSYENYYAQYGETWERMALVKARCVAGDEALGQQFVEMLQPFVYPRHAGEHVLRQMAAVKERIEKEMVREDMLTRHVKLGIGGIREIEFIVQSFQVLRGARLVTLRERSTLRALPLLVKTKMLCVKDATALAEAYRFLRNVEHRLQMEMERQTHTIPDERRALERLARSLGFESVEAFFAAQRQHTGAVRTIYHAVLAQDEQRNAAQPAVQMSSEELPSVLARAGFADVPAASKRVEALWHGPGFGHVSQRTKELFERLLPVLLDRSAQAADPDVALARLEKFVEAYGSRGLLYEVLAGNPHLVEMLVRVGDASRFLSDELAQQPDLFDGICRGVTLSEPKTLDRMREELKAAGDETPMDAVREWKRGEMVRIGIEDVTGLVDIERVHQEMTFLAEACLQFAVEQACQELKLGRMPVSIIGMGKFGGQELGYGADLDVLFIGGTNASDQEKACRWAARVRDFMERQTASGTLFRMDARLRPDGEKGPLAGSLDAHMEYYRKRAQFWEWQALTKARPVAGDAALGEKFLRAAHGVIYAEPISDAQLEDIRRMRHRIETERGDSRHRDLEFKTGPGGLVDVEFVVQALQLRHGHKHPQLRTAHTLAALNRLTALGIVDDEQSHHLRRHYVFLRRIESVLRRAENTSVSRLPEDEQGQRLLARRLGFANAADFLGVYRMATEQVRALYSQLL